MEKLITDAVPPNRTAFFSFINHPFKAKLYLLKQLPAAFFSGLKIVDANEKFCIVSVPYKWFTKNPFRSTYFACLSMGAELSTGVLAMANVYQRNPAISMLIIKVEAKFYKKAKGQTFFQCNEGEMMSSAVASAIETAQTQEIKVLSTGRNQANETIAEFWFTWSFKVK